MKFEIYNKKREAKKKQSLFHVSYSKFYERGFTIVESLVAIAVFTVGISAAIFVIQQSFTVGSRVKNKIIAAHLAQEGIEVIRNIRDRNWMQGKVYNVDAACFSNNNCWINGINDSAGAQETTTGCVQYNYDVLYPLNNPSKCPGGQGGLVFSGSYYELSVNTAQFQRTVSTEFIPLDAVPDPDEPEHLKITSTVTCGAGCSVSLEEYLYNWK